MTPLHAVPKNVILQLFYSCPVTGFVGVGIRKCLAEAVRGGLEIIS